MKPDLRLLFVCLLLVVLPLVVVGFLGVALARNEREMTGVRFREVLVSQLRDVSERITGLLEERERALMAQPNLSGSSPEQLRSLARNSGLVRQYFVLDREGNLVYPDPAGELTGAEEDFLVQTRSIWVNGEIPAPEADVSAAPRQTKLQGKGPSAAKGWHAAYWGRGLSLIFWWRDESSHVAGAELNEARLMADIIAILPEAWPEISSEASRLPNGRIALTDAKGSVIYQWGGYLPAQNERPQAQLSLLPPLNAWTLSYYTTPEGTGSAVLFNILAGTAALAIALAGMAFYLYRENTRAMREAMQRVTFVNQVSHELKTPLTNIRMYAELLEGELAETTDGLRGRLDVIVSESQRLSRLINNVLTFGRTRRNLLTLHKTAGNVDEVLRTVLTHFEGALRAHGMEMVFEGNAAHEAEFDADAVQQILGNLLSNVEKYAVNSDRVTISSQQEGDHVTITVTDNGPGIPPRFRDRIFEPFYRVSDKLTDGVAGAGIGLTIARDLARLHGGDVTLEPSAQGSCFKVVLHAPTRHSGEAT
ncbi:MAG: HAMP domain-containing histidine kinase [Candidatus Hydrogenedentes bacterium]|nr:HAMP domain-containing histidine kinase [Candidatus Hydrogenedentota bacterium]